MIDSNNQILLSDEKLGDHYFTKFPGGGLEFGEGTRECLKREFKEELSIEIEIIDHYYTTDFCQVSSFRQNHQVISIYYLVKSNQSIDISSQIVDKNQYKYELFRWRNLNALIPSDLTFPIDQEVVKILNRDYA